MERMQHQQQNGRYGEREGLHAGEEHATHFAAIGEQRLHDEVHSGMSANEKELGVVNAMFTQGKKGGDMLLTTATGSALVALRERGELLTLREMLFLLINEPGSGRAAYFYGRLMTPRTTWTRDG